MTLLRKKMEEDLRLRGLAPATQYHYIRCVRIFAEHFWLSPDQLGAEHVRRFLLHLADQGRAPATRVVYWAALRFLFTVTLARPRVFEAIPRPRVPRQVRAVVLTPADVAEILRVAPSFDRAFFAVTYGCGLRVSEVCALQVGDIDARSGLLHVRRGKGHKARSVPLPETVLGRLRADWRACRRPGPWLFPAQRLLRPGVVHPTDRWADRAVSRDTMGERFKRSCAAARIKHHATLHDLRHAYATHMLAAGVDSRVLQVILGHQRLETTATYTHVDVTRLREVGAALEALL
jgi:integrase/recombinase XerD